tara:strand:+ start:179 stop:622 length:444 start_codon:yes stop_codon:yes gene_type:complete
MLVGNVIFVLNRESHSVVPCRIVEIVSSVTLEGQTTTHVVEAPGGKKRIRLEDHDTPWFETFESAKEYLLSAANDLVTQTMNRALKVAQKSFGFELTNLEHQKDTPEKIDSSETNQVAATNSESSELYVDMAGQKVRVTLPKELMDV